MATAGTGGVGARSYVGESVVQGSRSKATLGFDYLRSSFMLIFSFCC